MNDVTLLDGAMGSELRARGVEVPDHRTSIWSALALIAAPAEIVQLHADYISAGADVITTNNYAVTPKSLAREDMQQRVEDLTLIACDLASRARSTAGRQVRIAGSLPPLNISYRADLVGDFDDMLASYRILTTLMRPHVDLFICETMTTSVEARAACQAAAECGLPVWVAWTLEDANGNLRGGESIGDAVSKLADVPVSAFLINCSSATATQTALPHLRLATDRMTGAYSNPFLREPAEGQYSSSSPGFLDATTYAEQTVNWRSAGASIFGGCCGTSPAYVEAIGNRLREIVGPNP